MGIFICPRCGNRDERYIGYHNGVPYCRLCISFQGREASRDHSVSQGISLHLDYPLSLKQKEVSDKVVDAVSKHKNVFIHAVTGAGKTELVYRSMEYVLKRGGHVGFATPRKDVVIDLLPRIQKAFPDAEVVSVYGEHTSKIVGDILVLTTHQLYRYPGYFDLLIVDEIDAFPYRDNDLLHAFFRRSLRGNYILLSATPTKEDLENVKQDNGIVVTLFERYHHGKLPLPEFVVSTAILMKFRCLLLLQRLVHQGKPVFVFAPTIEEGESLFRFLNLFVKNGSFVCSKSINRSLDIERFKFGELDYLVTTSILERGVTVRNLQVIVYHSDHSVYQQATLVQIAGRVGRKADARDGNVYFIGEEMNQSIQGSIEEIRHYNQEADHNE